MVKFYLAGIFFLFATIASAQTKRKMNFIIKKNKFQIRTIKSSRIAASGCDTVNYPIPSSWTAGYFITGTDGFVTGNNVYGDQEKAAYFDMSYSNDTYLTKVWISFAVANSNKSGNLSKIIPIKIYDGTDGTPGALLGSGSKLLSELHQDQMNNFYSEIIFSSGIELPQSKKIFISVDISSLTWNGSDGFDSLAIYSNQPGQSVAGSNGYAWEENTNTWETINQGWDVDMSLIIHPFISTNPTCAISNLSTVSFSGKVYLQGAYNSSTLTMNNTLNSLGILQLNASSQPYNITAFNYPGTESVALDFFSTHTDIVDWVLIELRDPVTPSTVAGTRAAFVKQDGTLIDIDGTTAQISFQGVNTGNYYVVIRHRNHLGIRSSATVDFGTGPGSYDFTTGSDKVYQSQLYPSTVQIGNIWAMRGGNANSNNNVKYNGPSNDENQILNVKLLGSLSNIINNVYAPEDINMNGNIKWNGPGNDQNFLLNTILQGSLSTIYIEQL